MSVAFANSDALAMCVRLRHARKLSRELEDVLGVVLIDIADMAARLMPNSGRFVDDDMQMEAVTLMLTRIDEGRVDTSRPHAMVNYFVKMAQNRYRNIVRNRVNRERLRAFVPMSEVIDDPDTPPFYECSDIDGRAVPMIQRKTRVSTDDSKFY